MLIIFLLAVWIGISVLVGNYGKTREIGFAGAFFISFLLSPLLAMLFVLASDKVDVNRVKPKPIDPAILNAKRKAHNKHMMEILMALSLTTAILIIGIILLNYL